MGVLARFLRLHRRSFCFLLSRRLRGKLLDYTSRLYDVMTQGHVWLEIPCHLHAIECMKSLLLPLDPRLYFLLEEPEPYEHQDDEP